jgi:hypothetical protein
LVRWAPGASGRTKKTSNRNRRRTGCANAIDPRQSIQGKTLNIASYAKTSCQLGLCIVLAAAFLLAGAIAFISMHFDVPIFSIRPESLIATKLTFLSIILALGMFQYKYFYDETKEVDERPEKGDFGPGWLEYVRQAQEPQRIVEAEATQLLQAQKILNGVTKTGNENQQLDVGSLRASLQERTQKLEQVRRTLSEMNSKIRSVKAEWEEFIRSILIDFAFRLALIFAICFSCFCVLDF